MVAPSPRCWRGQLLSSQVWWPSSRGVEENGAERICRTRNKRGESMCLGETCKIRHTSWDRHEEGLSQEDSCGTVGKISRLRSLQSKGSQGLVVCANACT